MVIGVLLMDCVVSAWKGVHSGYANAYVVLIIITCGGKQRELSHHGGILLTAYTIITLYLFVLKRLVKT